MSLKNKFNNWYANQIWKQLDVGTRLGEIVIKLQLSLLKPLHAAWIVDFYNEMSKEKKLSQVPGGQLELLMLFVWEPKNSLQSILSMILTH